MNRFIKYISTFLIALFLVGCGGAAIQNIDNSGTIQKKATLKQVEAAISKGAMRKNWSTKKIKDGQLEARINVRGRHLAVVTIDYTTSGYGISYKDSQNLKYNADKQTIHKSYNKWVATLEQNINYELSQIGVKGVNSSNSVSTTASTPQSSVVVVQQPMHGQQVVVVGQPMVNQQVKNSNYKKVDDMKIEGKTIYIKSIAPYSPNAMIAENIKAECTIDKQIVDFIVEFGRSNGVNIEVKDNIAPDELELKVEIVNAVSRGGAFRGHSKWAAVDGAIVKGKEMYYSFKAARISGGGFFGAYKSSCSVLGRTVKAMGKDIGTWLGNPMDGAKLGDTYRLR